MRSTKSHTQRSRERDTALERQTIIVLSTGHVPESLANAGFGRLGLMDRIASMQGEHGWLVNVNAPIASVDGQPESIVQIVRDILHWAKRRGADFVLFDADGPLVDRFPVYDW